MGTIGFVGLGIMGRPMAKNLIKAGYSVIGFSRRPAVAEEMEAEGLAMGTLEEIGSCCDVIITMLPNSPDVIEVVLGKEGLIHSMNPGTLVIDMTSGAPEDSVKLYQKLQKKGIHFIDAPVSGGEPMAVKGTLAIMAGGDQEDFQRAEPILLKMGKSATWVGPVGSGNTCKLANQVIVALNIAALSEGMMLAKKAGADTQKVFEAIQGGLAGSAVMNAKTPMILADSFQPGFRIDLHIKDLINAIDTGNAVKAPLPLTEEILKVLKGLSAEGNGNCDHSAIAKYYENLSGEQFSEN